MAIVGEQEREDGTGLLRLRTDLRGQGIDATPSVEDFIALSKTTLSDLQSDHATSSCSGLRPRHRHNGRGRAACTHPLATVQSLLDNLQASGEWNPSAAAECFPPSEEVETTALHLKQVLDARGLYIDFDQVPTDPDYKNSRDEHKWTIHDRLPKVYLERVSDRWVFSGETVKAVPGLYADSFSGIAKTLRSTLPPPFHRALFLGLMGWQFVLFGILALVSFLAGRVAHSLLQNQVIRVAKRLRIAISPDLVSRMQTPLTWAAMGAVFMVGIPDLQLGARSAASLNLLAQAALSIAIMVVFLRLADMVSDLWKIKAEETDTKLDDQLIPLANRAVKIVIWALGLLSILDNLGVDVTSLLAGVTISGLAVALAAKDTVENLFGSIMIFVDRPFQIDDYIEVEDPAPSKKSASAQHASEPHRLHRDDSKRSNRVGQGRQYGPPQGSPHAVQRWLHLRRQARADQRLLHACPRDAGGGRAHRRGSRGQHGQLWRQRHRGHGPRLCAGGRVVS